MIRDYTREEYYGNTIAKSCIDHIVIRVSNASLVPAVIKQKVADHYLVALAILGESPKNEISNQRIIKTILDNKKVDHLISMYDWN